jgi:8-oxo-dGTP pyrophosphatase MutT (NUDIX family)
MRNEIGFGYCLVKGKGWCKHLITVDGDGEFPFNACSQKEACNNGSQYEATKFEILKENEWVSLHKIVSPEKGINGYVYSHETRCKGNIVVVFPYRINKETHEREFLLRSERTPCWSVDENVVSSLTGGVEEHGTAHTAVMELEEEAGYKVSPEALILLGTSYGTKSCDTIYTIYTTDLTDVARGEPTESELRPDGGRDFCVWGTEKDVLESKDPMVSVAYLKLLITFYAE